MSQLTQTSALVKFAGEVDAFMRAKRVGALVLFGVAFIGCRDHVAPAPNPAAMVTGVTVFPASLTMFHGEKSTLSASVVAGPEQSNLRVRWRSSAPAVASVDSNGVVSSLASGLTTITATSLADTLYSGSCAVFVSPGPKGIITIQGINDDGQPADLSGLSGKIDVIVSVDSSSPVLSRVEALLTRDAVDTVVASFTPGGSTGQTTGGPTTLSFNTLGLKNGEYLLKVRLILTNGGPIVSSYVTLTIKNP